MQGKVCVISGDPGSIGVATAKLLLREGAKVMLMDLNEAALKKAATEIGGDCVAWSVSDVTKSDQLRSFVEATVDKWGNIDVLLSNAGNFGIAAPVTDYPEDIFDSVIAVHVKGAFLSAKHVLPHMNDGGSIIITSSIVGVKGDAGVCAYVTAKHAQCGCSPGKLPARNIRVNTIHPGPWTMNSNRMSSGSSAEFSGATRPRSLTRSYRSGATFEPRRLPVQCSFSPPMQAASRPEVC
jgi:NAD(P)-dependent dehydrogenase (short-subunit alcohol dehydrogenase family)